MLEFSDEAICVEEVSTPRPHYRVTLKSALAGHPDLLPGLLRDELSMTVCLPADVGSDLNMIKQAAARRFAAIATEMSNHQFVAQQQDHRVSSTPDKSCATPMDRHRVESRSQETRQRIAAGSEAD